MINEDRNVDKETCISVFRDTFDTDDFTMLLISLTT